MESQSSAQQQLDALAADREVLRDRACLPFWYWAVWSLAVNWWGLIAVVPSSTRWWLGLAQWAFFVVAFVVYSQRRVRVPRPPLTWPTLVEWLVLIPLMAVQISLYAVGVHSRQAWIITAAAAFSTVALAVFAHRTQRVVFRDER